MAHVRPANPQSHDLASILPQVLASQHANSCVAPFADCARSLAERGVNVQAPSAAALALALCTARLLDAPDVPVAGAGAMQYRTWTDDIFVSTRGECGDASHIRCV